MSDLRSEEYYSVTLNPATVTVAQMDDVLKTMRHIRLRAVAREKAPQEPKPTVLFEAADWTRDFDRTWIETVSPDGLRAFVQPLSAYALEFNILASIGAQAGARALYDPTLTRAWTAFAACHDRTVEFVNVWHFPEEIPNYVGDRGFISAGWQFKHDSSAGAPAGMAMNLHTFRGEGMRWWLQANTFDARAQDDTFPLIPVGVDVTTRLLVHFHDDPARGWMELHYAERSLKVTGANMAADRTTGAYMLLYGTCDAVMLCREARITVLD